MLALCLFEIVKMINILCFFIKKGDNNVIFYLFLCSFINFELFYLLVYSAL